MSKYCIFDLDGTILDTITTITYYLNLTLCAEGISPVTIDEAKYFVGSGARVLIERTLKSKGITDEETIARVHGIYKESYDRAPLYLTEPYKGIKKALSDISFAGIKMAVVSNKPHSATHPIVEHFFPGVFDAVYGALDGVAIKPATDIPAIALSEIGGTPSETVFIGDTDIDIMTGKNLGVCKTVGVLWGFRTKEELERAGADVIVSSPAELLEVIKG